MLLALAGGAPAPHSRMASIVLTKYRYRRRLPHLQRADRDLFVTFRTARVILTSAAGELVLQYCLREGGIVDMDRLAGGGARSTTTRGHEFGFTLWWSCLITFTFYFRLCGMRMAGHFLSSTFCSA